MIFEFYCLMLMIMFRIADFSDPKEDSFFLAYYPSDQIFASVDPITISNAVNQDSTKFIINFCPISNVSPFTSIIANEKVWKPGDYDESLRDSKCYSPIQLFVEGLPFSPYRRVGFRIFFDFNLLNEYKMKTGNLSAADDYPGKRIFFYEFYRINFDWDSLRNYGSQHRIVMYRRGENRQIPTQCNIQNMIINDEDDETFKRSYDKNNQKKNIEKNFQWPTSINEGDLDEYFIMHQMVPIDDFTDEFSRFITCRFHNTVPLWKSISIGRMKRVEQHIRTVAENLPPNTLLIGTIPIDTLEAKKNWMSQKNDSKPFYLDMKKKKIPVPKLIVKLIIYRAPWLNGGKTGERGFHSEKDEYAIAIVVHNELGNEIKKVCGSDGSENACTKYGWFGSDNEKDEGVYCCDYNDEFFKYKFHYFKLESSSVFDLNNVLWKRGEGNIKNEFRNIAKDIRPKTESIPEK